MKTSDTTQKYIVALDQGTTSSRAIVFDHAQNIVVIKTMPGLASAACSAIDAMNLEMIVGTLAGDDTIFVLIRNEERAIELMSELKNLLNKKLP